MDNQRIRRSAIVTGASRGIGRAITLRLGSDGYDLSVNDLPAAQAQLAEVADEIRQHGATAVVLVGDVSSAGDVERMVRSHVERYGGLDVMVANAGIAVTAQLLDTTVEQWRSTMAVNLEGVFNCYQAAARIMIAQGRGGRLIGAASVAAHRGGRWQTAYAASKFGVRGLTQAVAQELGQFGITANTYSPGVVQTAMWDSIDETITTTEGRPRGTAMAAMVPTIPLARLATPEDVAGVVSFLASEDSSYVTGQSIIVDGGMYFS
jgi:meso-butanediol dehydrogenase/(S,S)-butanediol dehydrogenase/diacetyl reductase